MKLYKLTDENGQTHGGTQWGPGVTHTATGDPSQELCSNGWIHLYTSPLLAVLLNPIHANFRNPKLWEAEGEIGKEGGLKVGCRAATTIREIPLPKITTAQKVRFGILCAKRVCPDEKWNAWADDWLSGKDRSPTSADAAYAAACAARAAYAAACAAYAAACAADAADAARAACAARAAYAADAASAEAVADLAALAERAVREEEG